MTCYNRSFIYIFNYNNIIPLCGTVLVLSSAQSAGIPNISKVTYGSVTSPLDPEPFGLGKCWPLII